jgi:hypothetical protein
VSVQHPEFVRPDTHHPCPITDTPASQARPGHASNVIDISMDDVDDDSDDENDMEAVGM